MKLSNHIPTNSYLYGPIFIYYQLPQPVETHISKVVENLKCEKPEKINNHKILNISREDLLKIDEKRKRSLWTEE